jgi:hypothetical protein
MSDRIDHYDDSAGALFASIIARESGTARSLVPRLPTMFEATPAGDAPEPVADEVVAPLRPAPLGRAAPPVAEVGPWPERSVPFRGEDEPVQRRHEVVRVERQVLVEAAEGSTPGDRDGGDRGGAPRPGPAAPDENIPHAHERRAAPPVAEVGPWPERSVPFRGEDEPVQRRHEVVRVERQVLVEAAEGSTPGDRDGGDRGGAPPEPRGAVRPLDKGPELRPLAAELAVPAPEGPAGQADRPQDGLPVVVTRREVPVPRPEQARATPELPRPVEPVVRVTIGRLEIRAVPDSAPAQTPRRERRTQSLDDYLERRNQGSRP